MADGKSVRPSAPHSEIDRRELEIDGEALATFLILANSFMILTQVWLPPLRDQTLGVKKRSSESIAARFGLSMSKQVKDRGASKKK